MAHLTMKPKEGTPPWDLKPRYKGRTTPAHLEGIVWKPGVLLPGEVPKEESIGDKKMLHRPLESGQVRS